MKRILLAVLLLPVFWCVRLLQECAKIPCLPLFAQNNAHEGKFTLVYLNKVFQDINAWKEPLDIPPHWTDWWVDWIWYRPCPVLPWRVYGLLNSLLGWSLARSPDGGSVLLPGDADLRVCPEHRSLSQPVHGSGAGADTVNNDGICTSPSPGHPDLSRSCESPSPEPAHERAQ